jgi:hypothetical protein
MQELQKRGAVILGLAYVTGVAVSSIHLNRFGINDLALAKISYISSGFICLGFVSVQILIALALANFKDIFSQLQSTHGAVEAALKELWLFRQVDRIAKSRILRIFLRSTPAQLSYQVFILLIVIVVGLVFFAASLLFEIDSIGLGLSLRGELAAITKMFLFLIISYWVWIWISPPFRSQRALRLLWRLVFAALIFWNVVFYAGAFYPILRPAFGGGAAYRVRLEPKDENALTSILQLLQETREDLGETPLYLLHESDRAYYITDKYTKDYGSGNVGEVLLYGRVFRIDKGAVFGYEIVRVP